MANHSPELAQIAAEAADLAKSAQRPISTLHALLGILTVPCDAADLLRDRGCDEERLLALLSRDGRWPQEPAGQLDAAMLRARELADQCGHAQARGLHLLLALTRLNRSAAAGLLEQATQLASLRTAGLGQLTAGPPRRARAAEVPVSQAQAPALAARSAAAAPRAVSPAPLSVPAMAAAGPALPYSAAPAATGGALHASPAAPASFIRTSVAPAQLPGAGLSAPAPSAGPAGGTSRWALDPNQTPWLCTHARNLSLLASQGRIDDAIGRAAELDELLDILGKRRSNNPVLVGEPGVGKTAIAEGLARRWVELAEAGTSREDRILVELDVGGLLAGTALRGAFSERLKGIQDEVRRAEGRIVVFVDELHMLIGAGSTGEGPQDAANELKAALARGEFPCVGATTHDEFRRFIQGDPALERRFTPVLVREPSPADAVRIVREAAPRYASHHGVEFDLAALSAAVTLTARHVRDRCLPDKAFAAIDLAGSRARREGRPRVEEADVARAVARMSGLPEERLLAPDGERLLSLSQRLSARVVGHEHSLMALSRALRRNFAGFAAQKPLASFLFLGPPGAGKAHAARVLADELFGDGAPGSGAVVRIDLAEFADPQSATRLVGAAPGYVGYGEGGLLTEAVRRRPGCVVLLDGADRAHPSILQLLLQILEEGQLTDGRGRRIDFTGAAVIATSDAGSQAFGGGRSMGFTQGAAAFPAAPSAEAPTLPPAAPHPLEPRVLEGARAAFPSDLWSRFDERLVFAPLDREQVGAVARLLMAESARRLWDERRISFRPGPGLVEHVIAAGGWEPSLGARPIQKAIAQEVESALADAILAGRFASGARLLAVAAQGRVDFRADPAA